MLCLKQISIFNKYVTATTQFLIQKRIYLLIYLFIPFRKTFDENRTGIIKCVIKSIKRNNCIIKLAVRIKEGSSNENSLIIYKAGYASKFTRWPDDTLYTLEG